MQARNLPHRQQAKQCLLSSNLPDTRPAGCRYYLLGYAFAFGDSQSLDSSGAITYSGNPFLGTNFFALSGLPHDEYYLWLFQWSVRPVLCENMKYRR